MAEQLRNVSAMDAVCALHHISTSGLLALGVYIYIHMTMHAFVDAAVAYLWPKQPPKAEAAKWPKQLQLQ